MILQIDFGKNDRLLVESAGSQIGSNDVLKLLNY
jgi:hypothetical protein